MSGVSTFPVLIAEDKIRLEGNASIIPTLQDQLVPFSSEFEIMPGTLTARPSLRADHNLFKQLEPACCASA